jgi:hypothetical protein
MRIIFAAVLSITQRPKIQKKAENNEFYNLKVNKAMNIKEFRTLTGQEVTENEFEDINKLYMATGNMDKQTFCGLWKKNDLFRIALEVERNLSAKVTFAEKVLANKEQELDDMKDQQAAERENMSHAADVLLAVDEADDNVDAYEAAIELVTRREVVERKVRMGLRLREEDKKYILNHLNK